jgi:hypothetical protein
MVSTFTPNYNLELQGTGDNTGTWGEELNNNVFSTLDASLGSALILSVSGGSMTLNSTQMENLFFGFQGTLISDQTIIFPPVFRPVIIRNTTNGSFNLNIKTSDVSSVIIAVPQGTAALYYLAPSGVNTLADVYAASASVSGNLPMYTDTSGRSLTDSGIKPPVIASTAEAQAGTSNTVYNSPLATNIQTTARLASQGQAQGGTDNNALMTPLRTSQAIQVQATSFPATSTDPNLLSFPLGTVLCASAPVGSLNRNQPTFIYLDASDGTSYRTSPNGAPQCDGTWLSRGRIGSSILAVRIS